MELSRSLPPDRHTTARRAAAVLSLRVLPPAALSLLLFTARSAPSLGFTPAMAADARPRACSCERAAEMFVLASLVLGAAAPAAAATDGRPFYVPAECSDLSGVWRHATVNPSRQYIAGVSPGKLNRWQVRKKASETGGEYTVACASGPCMTQNASSTLSAVTKPLMNGTVSLLGAAPMASSDDDAAPEPSPLSPKKCTALDGTHWCLGHGCGEQYLLSDSLDGSAINVSCVKGPGSPCSSWQSATGAFDAASQTLAVKFNSGGGQTGFVSDNCKRVYWCDKSAGGCKNFWCQKGACTAPAPPAPPPGPQVGILSIRDHCHAIFWYTADGSTDGGTSGGPAWYREVAAPPTNVTVHIVPHSHLDPGWLWTVQDMYAGTRGFTNSGDKGPHSPAASKGIGALITAMVAGVAGGSERTFAPEIAVFYDMWWRDANATQRATVRRLVQEGRLEWTGGGWTQHDEASSRVEDQVDQLTLGHLWLKSVVGAPPVRSAWQPDPFGHSSTAAYVFRLSGFDFYAFGRGATEGDPINQQTAALWHPLRSFPDQGRDDAHTMLTREQRTGYWNPFRSNHVNLLAQNAEAVADNLILLAQDLVATAHPAASNVLIMFGDDHRWEDAPTVMAGLDAAIAAMNARTPQTGIRSQYSTPSRFAAALNAEEIEFPARPPSWDMLPLVGDEMGAPWSGFFTSRPGFKALVRASSSMWRASSQLHALRSDPTQWLTQFANQLPLWKAMGLAVAHDALPGDGFGVVSDDFTARLKDGIGKSAAVAAASASGLLRAKGGVACAAVAAEPGLQPCLNASLQLCATVADKLAAGKPATVTVYNPQASARTAEHVELLVPAVAAAAGLALVPSGKVAEPAATACQISPSHVGGALLTFRANLLPLALHTFVIAVSPACAGGAGGGRCCVESKPTSMPRSGAVLSNGQLSLSFNGSGHLQYMTSNTTTVAVTARMLSYQSQESTENSWDFTTNGNGGDSAVPFPGERHQHATILRGALYDEVVVEVDTQQGVSLRYRLPHDENVNQYVQLWITSGPFNVSFHKDQNVIFRLDSSIQSRTRLLVDSNALEFVARDRDQRPWQAGSWIDAKEPVSSNYYPATLAAILPTVEDTPPTMMGAAAGSSGVSGGDGGGPPSSRVLGPALALLVGSAQGVASLSAGSLELMVNRAVLKGDKADPISCTNSTDNHLTTMRHGLMLGRSDADGAQMAGALRPVAAAIANPVQIFAASASTPASTTNDASIAAANELCQPVAPMSVALPPQLELLSLHLLPPGMNISLIDDADTQYNASTKPHYPAPPVASTVLLLRLRHIFATGDGGVASALGRPVTVNLRKLFVPHWKSVRAAVEVTVDGVTPLSEREANKLHWKQQQQRTPLQQKEGMLTPDSIQNHSPDAVTTTMDGGQKGENQEKRPSLIVTIRPMEIRTWRIEVVR